MVVISILFSWKEPPSFDFNYTTVVCLTVSPTEVLFCLDINVIASG